MAVNNNEIPNINIDWQGYSGKSVLDFIKKMFRQTISDLGGKFGHVTYEGGKMQFYDADGGTTLGAVTITGTSYIVEVGTNYPSGNIVVLTQDTSSIITIAPKTYSIEFGSSVKEDYPEDYTFKLEIDNGLGFIDRTPTNNTIKNGASANVEIRNYITTGVNRARIVVTGVNSGLPKTLVFTVTLTSLSLNVEHTWHQVWMQGNNYFVQNIYFSGNISKTLHIKLGENEYTQEYSASTLYVNVPTTFDLTNYAPTESGTIPLEIWMTGEGVETKHIYYLIMYVTNEDKGNVSLICFNNVPSKVYNFKLEDLVQYSTYNIGNISTLVKALYDSKEVTLLDTTENIVSNTIYTLSLSLQIDTDLIDGINLSVEMSGNGVTKSVQIPVDNSNAFIPTPDAKFYLNASLGSNSTSDKDKILNSAPVSEGFDAIYDATWENFTFSKDAWDYDEDGNRALVIKAGSTLKIPNLKPLRTTTDYSTTFEIMYRASAVADYDTPIFTCIDTETYDKNTSVGIVIFPTRILVISKETRNEVFQQLLVGEDRINHIIISFQKKFGGKANNLCRIFINGVENVTYTYKDTDTFYPNTALQYGGIVTGQLSTDTYIYMMRIYKKGFEELNARDNFLNAVIESAEYNRLGLRDDNNIIDGNTVDYYMTKKAGFNTYVVETDLALPSLKNPVSYSKGVNIHLEYNDHPEWNVSIYDAPLDRQGTTSSLYMWANLRSKIKKALRWRYHNLKDDKGNVLEETSKNGYLFGYKSRPKVQKITWKKNIASQPQGHKMGATGIYNDLFKLVFGAEKLVTEGILPSIDTRVATEQVPFIGFQLHSNGLYDFIGMYTGGPDKTDKKTFGYDRTDIYPKLMMIEGPNHDPYMTRFLVPWTEDVFYDYLNETLSVGAESPSDGSKQEGWDADIIAGYGTDSVEDASAIMDLYLSEFKPAYDAIYYCSPYLVSLDEALAASGYASLDDINNNLSSYLKKETNGYSNILLTLYDSQYRLIYYRVKTGKYEILPLSTHNMLEYLGLSGTPTTEEIIEARRQKWINPDNGVAKYVNLPEAYYHNVFCEFLGVTDNDAKNTYWRKFKEVALGGKWGFNQDDLDTLMQNDNNGQDTKEYYVEPNDTLNGNDIFQGRTSAFWYALRLWCKDNIKGMASEFIQAAYDKAEALNIGGNSIHERVLGLISYYMWKHSSKYFPAAIYNADTKLAYIDVWYENPSALYNNVPPLTLIHGDHYETERAWMEKRIAYFFSKYLLGAFKSSSADNYGSLEFTPASGFDMKVKPAIWLYPRISIGGSETEPSVRTEAGLNCTLTLPSSGTTGVYIKGLDWLSDLGDLSKLQLTSRGGSDVISFSVNGKRLRKLKVGDETNEVLFNATNLAVVGKAIEEIDARNANTIQGTLDLKSCPRLRKIYLSGTALTSVFPPIGGRVTTLQLPDTLVTLFLHSLNLLNSDGLTLTNEMKANLTTIYINSCDNLNAFELLKEIYNTEGNKLANIGILWKGVVEDTDPNNLIMLGEIARVSGQEGGYRGASYNENGDIETGGKVSINGTLNINYNVYPEDIEAVLRGIPDLKISYNPDNVYVPFEDLAVRLIVANKWGDGIGTTLLLLDAVTNIGTTFTGNTNILTFNELSKFSTLKNLPQNCFKNCTNLLSIDLSNVSIITGTKSELDYGAFFRCTSLTNVNNLLNCTSIGKNAFNNCISLAIDVNCPKLTELLVGAFYKSGIISVTNLGSTKRLPGSEEGWDSVGVFQGCTSLTNVDMSSVTSVGDSVFQGCTSLTNVDMSSVTSVGDSVFQGCTSLTNVDMSSVTSVGDNAFRDTGPIVIKELGLDCVISGSWKGGAFRNSKIKEINLDNVKTIYTCSFCNCTDLTNIGSGNMSRLLSIMNGAFENCSLENTPDLYLPNCTSIGDYAFKGTKIKNIHSLGLDCVISGSLNGGAFRNSTLETINLENVSKITGYIGGISTLTSVGNSFNRLTSLTNDVFNNCTNLVIEDFSAPNLETLGYGVFANTKIRKVSNLGSITSIGDRCFYNCKELTEFTDPINPCKYIRATEGCSNLTKIHIQDNSKWFRNTFGENNYSNPLENKVANFYINNELVDTMRVPDDLTVINGSVLNSWQGTTVDFGNALIETIQSYAFYKCTNLTTCNIPESVTTINNDAFRECTSLEFDTLNLPNLTSLGGGALQGVKIRKLSIPSLENLPTNTNYTNFGTKSVLEEVVLSSKCTIIPAGAFSGYTNLTTINLSNVTTFNTSCFYNTGLTGTLTLPLATDILYDLAFRETKITSVSNLGSITLLGSTNLNNNGPFYHCKQLESVTLPETLTIIGVKSFSHCTSLKSINFPDNITNIAAYTFYGCNNLVIESLNLPNLTSLGNMAFSYCYNLKKIENLGSITTIEATNASSVYKTFIDCINLRVVVLPSTLLTLGTSDTPFRGCTALEDVICYAIVPPSAGSANIFPKNKLKGIYVPNSSIDAYKSATNWINYADYIYPISDYVEGKPPMKFADAEVQRIVLSNYDTNKSGYLSNTELLAITGMSGKFDNNTLIETFNELELFTSLKVLPTFLNCTSLTSVKLPSLITSLLNSLFKGCTALTTFAIPDTVTSVGADAFMNSGLNSLTSWGGVTKISSSNIFRNCVNLTSVPSLSGITEITGTGTFLGDTGISSISGLLSLSTIGSSTFDGCTNLTINNLSLPNLITLRDGAFRDVNLLGSINLPSITTLGESVFSRCKNIYNVISLGSITTIGSKAFDNCASLSSVNFPESLKEIGYQAFLNCTALSNIRLPEGLTTLNQSFRGCTSLTLANNTLPLSITTLLNNSVFDGCSNLVIDDLNLPNLTTLSNGCFNFTKVRKISNLGSITTVTGFRYCSELESVVLPETITDIAEGAFVDCPKLKSINLPESITKLGLGSFNASTELVIDELYLPNLQSFSYYGRLFAEDLYIPKITSLGSITTLPNEVFRKLHCDSIILPDTLVTLTGQSNLPWCPVLVLPASVESLEQCFRGNDTVETIVCKATTPPTADSNIWTGTTSLTAIYVPDASVEAYKTATNWSSKANIIFGISQLITDNPERFEEIKDQLGGNT